jgi:hypothetical protein
MLRSRAIAILFLCAQLRTHVPEISFFMSLSSFYFLTILFCYSVASLLTGHGNQTPFFVLAGALAPADLACVVLVLVEVDRVLFLARDTFVDTLLVVLFVLIFFLPILF